MATAVLALAAPASAQETSLSGATSSGIGVTLKVGVSGNATSFKVDKHKVECGRGTLSNKAFTYRKLDTSDPGHFQDRRKGKSRSGELRFKTKTSLEGTAAPDFLSWTGTYKATTKVFRGKKRIDVCHTNDTWTVG
jgi:hypothetical protein